MTITQSLRSFTPWLLARSPLTVLVLATSLASAADKPYQFSSVYTADYLANIDGGVSEDEAYLDKLDLFLDIDMEQAYGLQGGSLYANVFYTNAETFSDIVGDAQVASNIENSYVVRVLELWYEQALAQGQTLKFGLYDLNTEFDAIDSAGLFLNSSHGIGADYAQSGENGPSIFPVSSLSLRYFKPLSDTLSIQLAVLDAVPGDLDNDDKNTINLSSKEGALLALEANYQSGPQRFGLGAWHYTQDSATLDGSGEDNSRGLYAIVERRLLDVAQSGADLDAFLRYGVAEQTVNQFDSYLGMGLVLSGFTLLGNDESIGFAIARANNGDDYQDLQEQGGFDTDSNETTFELSYRNTISDRVTLQPDIQYIKNPGTDATLDDALVVAIRIEITLF